MILPTTHPLLDSYLHQGFEDVRGMSSAFSTAICGYIMEKQKKLGFSGAFGEIGTFEGRFFIGMALTLAADEIALGIDVFTWPSEKVLDHLHANCVRFGLDQAKYRIIKGHTGDMTSAELARTVGGAPFRLFHIDGQHDDANLTNDLNLVAPLMHEHGVIVLDDMLHPAYPELAETAHRWLRDHPEWRVLAILDREDIVAAAKYVLCRTASTAFYEADLLSFYAPHVFPMGCDVVGHFTMVLTPHPRLAVVE